MIVKQGMKGTIFGDRVLLALTTETDGGLVVRSYIGLRILDGRMEEAELDPGPTRAHWRRKGQSWCGTEEAVSDA